MPDMFVNTKMDEKTKTFLDVMVKAEDTDRSKFIRRLIREEYARRLELEGEITDPTNPDAQRVPVYRVVKQ